MRKIRHLVCSLIAITFPLVAMMSSPTAAQDNLSEKYKAVDALPRRYTNKVIAENIRQHWLDDQWLFCEVPTDLDNSDYFLVDLNRREKVDVGTSEELLLEIREQLEKIGEVKLAENTSSIELLDFAISDVSGTPELAFSAADKLWAWSLQTKSLQVSESKKESAFASAMQTDKRRSRRSDDPIAFNIDNNSNQTLKFEWLDYSGRAILYGQAKPSETFGQRSFTGHVWKISPLDSSLEPIFLEASARTRGLSLNEDSFAEANQRDAEQVETKRREAKQQNAKPSRKPALRARFKDHNLQIRDDKGQLIFETTDGKENRAYRGRTAWSPDRNWLVVKSTILGDERKVTIVDAAPRDRLQPKTIEFNYTKPGDRLDQSIPVLIDLRDTKKVTATKLDSETLPCQWSLNRFRWAPDSKSFTFLYNKRGHQELTLFRCDVETKELSAVIRETSKTFIDYTRKVFLEHLDATEEVIWMSERDGWCHLYLFDSKTGLLKNQITSGEWVVRGVVRVDAEKRQIWFTAGGLNSEEDPYHRHLCRVDFDGGDFVDLTPADGDHEWEFSPDGRFLIDTWSRVDLPPVCELRSSETGELIYELSRADASPLIDAGWKMPQRFVAAGRDGKTPIHGFIIRPSHFDAAKKYPIIEAIYAGPHSAHVPKQFSRHSSLTQLAELGFIVVKIDGMGTSHRSKAFHDVCWKNLADAGFPDRKKWIAAAAEAHPEMDLSRVGIYGGSAGGQNAMGALLFHNDFYHAAAADCGCHDNRMDKIWWNEQWMGYPIDKHYEDQSNATNAHLLKGNLLLTVGALDRNVDPASTMQVVQALIQADKDFELIVFPRGGHGVGSGRYGRHRMYRFFEDSLLTNEN